MPTHACVPVPLKFGPPLTDQPPLKKTLLNSGAPIQMQMACPGIQTGIQDQDLPWKRGRRGGGWSGGRGTQRGLSIPEEG